jgi:hypothetical protein
MHVPLPHCINTIQYSSAYYAYQRVVPTKFFNMPGPSHAITFLSLEDILSSILKSTQGHAILCISRHVHVF